MVPDGARASTRESLLAQGSDERCENGEGAACERLAGDNDLIRQLQAQSKRNKAKNAEKIYDQTVMQLNYAEYFDSMDLNMINIISNS